MTISTRTTSWMTFGCVLALVCGTPALADDTELLLINPNPADRPKPNVLFIIDTSGSMDTEEDTTRPYDSAEVYAGNCRTDSVYWTDVDVVPVCDGTEENYVFKNVFHCDYAARQIAGIGSFTNTMVQYRDGGKKGNGPGPARWQYLALGYHDSPVECEADSGQHGDGRATFRWAANGTNLADPFTNVETNELSWGSAPRNLGYTFYDGNYLNWKSSPDNTRLQRIDIVKAVTTKVLSSVDNMNVGLMRFNDRDGGPVILAMQDLEANRAAVLAAIDSLPADGATPLSETLYEAALYWRGMPAWYGERFDVVPTDPAALISPDPEIYKHPEWGACAKNYNVLLTDGEPNRDDDTPGLAPDLPGFQEALERAECTGANEGDCLDDIAEYLSVVDIDPLTDGDQFVTTHTIGFSINLDVMREAAEKSGGQYFLADDVESLTKTLLDIIANINDRSLSFAAPSLSVNSFNRTRNLNDLYITMFAAKNKLHWPGNLKKYRIVDGEIRDANGNPAVDPGTGFFSDSSKSYWTVGNPDKDEVSLGGAANMLPDPANRNVYTNINGNTLTAANNRVSTGNADAFAASDLGLIGAEGEPSKNDLINWARGEDVKDVDNNDQTTVRNSMGDPLHSQPAAVVYGGDPENPDVVVYVATNDGYLHAIDADTGVELWSFIPSQLLENLTRLYFDPDARYKQYGIDGDIVPVVKDENNNGIVDGDDFVYLLFGLRRGGNTYFALDVTDRDKPSVLWTANFPELGESWSTPVVARVDISGAAQNDENAVVIFGGGYDTVHDTKAHPPNADGVGAGVHMLDLVSGQRLWRAGPDAGAELTLDTMTRAIPNQVRVIDINGDKLADRMYASDLGGQVWRFDIINGQNSNNLVTGGVIAQLGAEGAAVISDANTRRFYSAPDVSVFTDNVQNRRYVAISIGSGYRAHPYDLAAADRFYSLRDKDVFNQLSQDTYNNYPIMTEGDLVEVSGQTQTTITADKRGWKLTLPDNQKVMTASLTFDNEVFFVGFSPDSNAQATCAGGAGTNFLYRVSIINGDPIVPNIEALDPDDSDDARQLLLQQGGIAPSPAILFPSADDADCEGAECAPPPIACVGVQCFDPGFENNPVRTLWTQDGID